MKTAGTHCPVRSVAGRQTKYVFQGVGMIFKGDYVPHLRWKKDEPRENRFCFIGKNLDKKRLTEGFMACRVSEDLRFKRNDSVLLYTGDRAMCHSKPGEGGRWVPAKVLYTWDDGNPYICEYTDGDFKGRERVPVDSDEFIKAAPTEDVGRKRSNTSSRSRPRRNKKPRSSG